MATGVDQQEYVDSFDEFFREYYRDEIGELARNYPSEQKSLFVDWEDLYRYDRDLAEEYLKHPEDHQRYAEEALRLYDLPIDVSLGQAHVRIRNVPETTDIREIRADDVNELIAVRGIVRKATDVRPKCQVAAFRCVRCETLTRVQQEGGSFQEPHECRSCERQGPFRLDERESEFVDAQRIRIQESPEGLRGGETPQAIDVNIEDDVTGEVTPGDHVTATGILRLDQDGEGDSPIFDVHMEGISVDVDEEEFEDMDITEEDERAILELSDREDVYDQMIGAIAPSIHGYEQAKLAMVLQLFSGVTKHLPDESRIRGDLHMLLIGDPGTGKSQLLQYVKNIAPRSVYTSGKGSSSAGLTAAAVRDDFGDGQQWTLEAGALVLADQGVAAVDELDKMAADDRSAMHEALEQQSYHPDTEILLADGRRVEIGDLVDERMRSNTENVVDGVDCEILPVDDLRVHTVDLESNEATKVDVDRVSRHEAPDEFVRVTFSNGRSVTVTPEHPMFVGDGSETVPAAEIDEGEFVPAPRGLPNAPGGVALESAESRTREKPIELPDEVTPDLAEFLGLLVAEGHSYAGSSHEIGFSNQDEQLLAHAEELGQSVFGFESHETVNGAGTVTKRWISTCLYRWFEENVPEVMATARDKRIPAAVLGSSQEVIRRFLVGAFAGDGGVESEAMSFSTASPGLAEDYADALSKLGVASRIHHDDAEDSYKVYVMGDSTRRFVDAVVKEVDDRYDDAVAFADRSEDTPRHHDVLPTGVAEELRSLRKLLGLRLTGKYRPNLDEGYGVQVGTVEDELSELRDRIEAIRRDLAEAGSLAEVRDAVGWSGRELAERLDGETTSAVHYAEDGGYDQARRDRMTDAARGAVEAAIGEAERRIESVRERCELRYYRVRDVERVTNEGDDACDWVYDVTVEPTNTFVSKGVVLHNSISISKAGINATLKSRCSLLGAANPIHGRFDQYEPMGEQIDLEPALISRFDLIFTVTDQPDPDEDAELAEHILQANYAGQLNTQRERMPSPDVTADQVSEAQSDVQPTIDPELLRKYVAYAQQNCYPRMTDEARERIRDFYVELRSKGADEDAPVPVTARKLEALVRLAEASARVRLADTVALEDAERVIEIVRSCLQDIGVDPETGQFDADIVETGTSKTQRDRIKNLKALIDDMAEEYEEGVPVDQLLDRAEDVGIGADKAEQELEKLKQKGEVYEPRTEHVLTT